MNLIKKNKKNNFIFFYILALTGIILAAIVIFLNIGKGSIDLRDEALTACRSLYIYHHHNIFNIKVAEHISIRKPPFVYILTAISYILFGINELGLRIPNAFFGLAIFILITLASLKSSKKVGWLAPFILLGCFNLIRVSREALTDTSFIFFISLAFLSLYLDLLDNTDKHQNLYLFLYFLGICFGLLSKGPLTLLAFFYILLFLYFVKRNRALFKKYLVIGIIATIPFLIWSIVQYIYYPHFFDIYFGQEYLDRLNYHAKFLPQFIRGPFYYITNYWRWFRLSGVVTILLIFLIFYLYRYKKLNWNRDKFLSFLYINGAWLLYLIVASIASHKSRRYILPIFPLLTIVFVIGIDGLLEVYSNNRIVKYLIYFISLVCMVVGFQALYKHYQKVPDYLPIRKEIAIKIKPYKKWEIYTNDWHIAPILEFYLDKEDIKVVKKIPPLTKKTIIVKGKEERAQDNERREFIIISKQFRWTFKE